MAVRVRKNIWTLQPLTAAPGTPWDPTVEWYARAVRAMQARPIKSPTSWKYQAAIHEYENGTAPNTEPLNTLPSSTERARFWTQCQHNSWFFLPWHRIYLAYFEQIVAATVAGLGGPGDWALPYWNYSDLSKPQTRSLPPAFFLAKLPDGSPNPLLVPGRRPGANTGQIIANATHVDLSVCLADPEFTGQPGGNPGFGGPKTTFNHGGGFPFGKVEGTPHGSMHVRVGGFMGAFNSAGLDPLFWLHHCNIDRLWEVWRKISPTHKDPVDAAWLSQSFEFHDANGVVVAQMPSQFQSIKTAPLPYDYDDVSSPIAAPVGPAAAPIAAAAGVTVTSQKIPEMVGATSAPVVLSGKPATVQIAVDTPVGPAAAAAGVALAPATNPDAQLYLNIENVTGSGEAESYQVYVNVPSGDDPHTHPELFAGLLPMFGLKEASRAGGNHPGDGLHYSLGIGHIARHLQAQGRWDPADLRLTFVPDVTTEEPAIAAGNVALAPAQPIRVGRVSLYVA